MELIDAARRFCAGVAEDSALAPLHDLAAENLIRLAEPLHVAVCGQLSAGKSTLVNALVGRPVAITGVGETTQVNWWFRRGSPERIVVRTRTGDELTVPLGAPLPPVDQLDADAVEPITVYADHELLDDLVVIDTPGFFSPTETTSARARELISGRTERASAVADAVLYLSHELPGAARDVRALGSFRELFGEARRAPTNALLVLSKADEWWDTTGADSRTPIEIGAALLASHHDELWPYVWDALPVVGLLAEASTLPERIDEMLDDVRALAAHPRLRRLYMRARARADEHVPSVSTERRQLLLDTLGQYGLARALAYAASGVTNDELRARLQTDSGLPAVADLIRRTFRERSDLIRSDAALTSLELAALARPAGLAASEVDKVRRGIEELRVSRGGDGWRTLRALRLAMDPDVRISPGARRELRELFAGGAAAARLGMDPDAPAAELVAEARARVRRWRAVENARPQAPDRRAVAAVACEQYDALARGLVPGGEHVGLSGGVR